MTEGRCSPVPYYLAEKALYPGLITVAMERFDYVELSVPNLNHSRFIAEFYPEEFMGFAGSKPLDG